MEFTDTTLFYQKINLEVLPKKFRNAMLPSSSDRTINIRSNVHNMNDIGDWVSEFAVNTSTRWIFRNSCPESSCTRIVCKKSYVCHHSAFHKVLPDEGNRNKRGISKNTKCEAKITATVKKTTRFTKFRDPYTKDGLPAVITIVASHNHPLESLVSLKYLPPCESVQDSFLKYYEMGMSIAQACRYHENLLLFESNEPEIAIGNAMLNPRNRTVQYWYKTWREVYKISNDADTWKLIQGRISTYECKGVIIKHHDEPFCLLVVTPIMQRVHTLSCSKNELFIESTTCCGDKNYSITYLLSSTIAGAIPNGVLITKNRTTDAYATGFKLLQESLGSSFYGQNYPNVTMTDNCSPEITAAVNEVWPESKRFLSSFHIFQCVLRWLQDKNQNIPEDKQKIFMSSFQAILYCVNVRDAEIEMHNAVKSGKEYPLWQNYLEDQWENKEKWCFVYRKGLVNHHTNNFADISMRLFKDNIVNRIKPFNLVASLDFICLSLDLFYKHKLPECLNSENEKSRLYLKWVLKKTDYPNREDDIVYLGDGCYIVSKEDWENEFYHIDVKTGICDCNSGMKGTFCKHLAAVYKFFDLKCNNFPNFTDKDRCEMTYLALGEDKPNISDFIPFRDNQMDGEGRRVFLPTSTKELDSHRIPTSVIHIDEIDSKDIADIIIYSNTCSPEPDALPTKVESDEWSDDKEMESSNNDPVRVQNISADLENFISEFVTLDKKFGPVAESLQKATQQLRKVTSREQWENLLNTLGTNVTLPRITGSKTKTQPMALHLYNGVKKVKLEL